MRLRSSQLIVYLFIITVFSCEINKKSPEYIARQYLLALKNKNWEEAKKYSSKDNDIWLDMVRINSISLNIEDIKNINCIINDDNKRATCTFCCTTDSDWKYIYLYMDKDIGWQVYNKKVPPKMNN